MPYQIQRRCLPSRRTNQRQEERGAPRCYGKKIRVNSLLSDPRAMQEAPSPVYGEDKVMLRFRVRDLLWRPAGELVRFVAVVHPTRGALLLMHASFARPIGGRLVVSQITVLFTHFSQPPVFSPHSPDEAAILSAVVPI